jgi:phosphoglycolate phosphatase
MKYKIVIFDLDGTLLDTIQDLSDSVNAVLNKRGYPLFTVNDYKYFVGRGMDELIKTVMEKSGIDSELFEEFKADYVLEYGFRCRTNTRIFDGMMNVLNQLREKGLKLAILSNKPHFQTEEVVDFYFKDFNFDLVYGKKPEFRIKPYPESALDMIKKLNLAKEDVLYVGDTNTDIQTAINAGFTSVGVLWGFRTRSELEEAKADYIIENPSDLLNII